MCTMIYSVIDQHSLLLCAHENLHVVSPVLKTPPDVVHCRALLECPFNCRHHFSRCTALPRMRERPKAPLHGRKTTLNWKLHCIWHFWGGRQIVLVLVNGDVPWFIRWYVPAIRTGDFLLVGVGVGLILLLLLLILCIDGSPEVLHRMSRVAVLCHKEHWLLIIWLMAHRCTQITIVFPLEPGSVVALAKVVPGKFLDLWQCTHPEPFLELSGDEAARTLSSTFLYSTKMVFLPVQSS